MLLLDEPAANIDFEATAFGEEMIIWSAKDGTTIVMVSYNRARTERPADLVLSMYKDQLMEQTSAK